jgi:hypothetical protein
MFAYRVMPICLCGQRASFCRKTPKFEQSSLPPWYGQPKPHLHIAVPMPKWYQKYVTWIHPISSLGMSNPRRKSYAHVAACSRTQTPARWGSRQHAFRGSWFVSLCGAGIKDPMFLVHNPAKRGLSPLPRGLYPHKGHISTNPCALDDTEEDGMVPQMGTMLVYGSLGPDNPQITLFFNASYQMLGINMYKKHKQEREISPVQSSITSHAYSSLF